MATGTYSVQLDLKNHALLYAQYGLLAERDVPGFLQALHDAAQRVAGRPWVILGDLRATPPQPEMGEKILPLLGFASDLGCRQVALVVSMAALEMQIRRFSRHSPEVETKALRLQLFDDPSQAASWLGIDATPPLVSG